LHPSYSLRPVGPYRVWQDEEGPGIAMTRTLGDFAAKKIGLISVPEIQHIELTINDSFIVIGSDGIWDVMKSSEAAGFVRDNANKPNVAELLVNECRRRWDDNNVEKKKKFATKSKSKSLESIFSCDDITAVVCFF